ncbi:S8 family serine peptidase [Streptomyces sp. RG80]|uniref:S8 family serine peptidase n=1 Tax=Streptomyces sp. RG80 TaxID=3157340 RepID=UPI00338F7B34
MAYSIDDRLPGLVYAHASPRSVGSVSLFEADRITVENAAQFVSQETAAEQAEELLRQAGFTVLGRSPSTINIAGPPALYEEYFRTTLVTEEREVIQPGAVDLRTTRTFLDSVDTDLPGLVPTQDSEAAAYLEGVALEQPATTMALPEDPPDPKYWHLTLDEVAERLGARAVHTEGLTGSGVRLTMIDTGWQRHPYFGDRDVTVVLGPDAAHPELDEDGHGTCESANAIVVAPGIEFTMVKANLTNLLGAFDAAVARAEPPHVISMSLGYQAKYPPLAAADKVLAVSVSLAVARGIVVVCAAGNGHHAFPGQHPDVISVGGVYIDKYGDARASDYASGFVSAIYPDRVVPDVSGLVGMRPNASYIVLPAPPGSAIDRRRAPMDRTGPDDGWVVASGTSAAAPQVAGVCALLLEAYPSLTPQEVRSALENSALDVDLGKSNPVTGGLAVKGRDDSTGYGLVRADEALAFVGRTRNRTGKP